MPEIRFACGNCGRWFSFEINDNEIPDGGFPCPFCHSAGCRPLAACAPPTATGSYKYCRGLKRLIKFSDDIPCISPGGAGGKCAGCAGGDCSSCGKH